MTRDEKRRLHDVFDSIAEEFGRTRREPWDEVVEFVERLEGDVALDLGCGNGRHLELLASRFDTSVGVDFSRSMLALHGFDAVQAEVTRLPFRDSVADAALYIATLHHLPSHDERLRSLEEVARVVRDGGDVLVSVWAIEHPRFDGMRDEIRANDHDVHVPWVSEGDEHRRYYHIFDRDGFESLVSESSLNVESVELSSGNYYARGTV